VIAQKPGTPEASPELRAHWLEGSPGAAPDRLYSLLLTGGQSSVNKVVALVSTEPLAAPHFIVKRPRVPQAVAGLRREAANLHYLQQRCPQLTGIPRLVFSQETGPAFSVGETLLNGVPLYTRLQRDTYRTLAQRATTWLIGLAAVSASPQKTAQTAGTLSVELNDLHQAGFAPALQQPTRALAASLAHLPSVCEQRDFSPWNILIDEQERWNVLDWEAAELAGLPARDLVYFLTYLSFFVEGVMQTGAYRSAYRRLLDPTSFTGAVFAECQAHYAQAVGFDSGVLKALRIMTWAMNACAEHARLNARHEVRHNRLFVSLWEEELKEQPSAS
jgi:aminoglycoside phosphotransferase (APT) family kinase protein